MTVEAQIADLIRRHAERRQAENGGWSTSGAEYAAAAIAQLFAWKPIETAPPDGAHFLGRAVSGTTEFVVEAWREGDSYKTALDIIGVTHAVFLTQWAPLVWPSAVPEPPDAAVPSPRDRWSGALDPLKDKISAGVERVVASNRELFREHVGPKAVALLEDDDLVAKVSEHIYPALPFALRIVVKEDAFTAFLLRHRELLITALQRG